MKQPPKPTGDGRRNCSLALPAEDVQHLRTIMGWMLVDPRLKTSRIGYQTAVRYAIEHMIAHPPKHVGGRG